MTSDREQVSFLNWLLTFRDPRHIFQENPYFLLTEILYLACGFLLLKHAFRQGGRHVSLWITILLYGLITEIFCASHPDIDNFWHAEATVMLVGQRIPLYIVFVYPCFLYTSMVTMAQMKIHWLSQPFAVGLSSLIFAWPLDVMYAKHLFWTWHDTDPNLKDRHFHVPWSNYNFHLVFGSSFVILFNGLHKLLAWNKDAHAYSGLLKELVCAVTTSLVTFPMGLLFFAMYYEPLHLNVGILPEECVLSLVALYATIVLVAERNSKHRLVGNNTKSFDEVLLVVTLHYCFLVLLSILSGPENIRSTGYHETVGPCNETIGFYSISTGKKLEKRKYLCLTDYDEPYDFHCVQGQPKSGDKWFTICGTPYPVRAEYILLTCTVALIGISWFWQLLRNPSSLSRKQIYETTDKPKIN